MKFSIIIPTYNNLNYLKKTIYSIVQNSNFNHELIIHVNDGSDGTLNFITKNNFLFTHSKDNIGLCSSMNTAASKSSTNYILYSHDDMYFCKNWDLYLLSELKKINDNLFYLSGTTVSVKDGLINYDCGNNPKNFDEDKFDKFCDKDQSPDLQGSHWAPHLIHKDVWNRIGGFSEEFNPGDGSDPDLCMKLWNINVRIFKAISKFKVYHFSSVTTRKRNINLNNGTKIFLLKYGFNPKFFRKYYLRGDGFNVFEGKIKNPEFSISMIFDLLKNKLKYYYFKFFLS